MHYRERKITPRLTTLWISATLIGKTTPRSQTQDRKRHYQGRAIKINIQSINKIGKIFTGNESHNPRREKLSRALGQERTQMKRFQRLPPSFPIFLSSRALPTTHLEVTINRGDGRQRLHSIKHHRRSGSDRAKVRAPHNKASGKASGSRKPTGGCHVVVQLVATDHPP